MMPGRARVHRRAARRCGGGAQRPGRCWTRPSGWWRATAPQLQGILNEALESADWFGSAHQAEVLRAAGVADPDERIAAVRTLIAEETRVSMLIGVAVGYELARQLTRGD